jgi:hypothetical protein
MFSYENLPQPVIGSFDCKIKRENGIISLLYLNHKNEDILSINIPENNVLISGKTFEDFFNVFEEFVKENTINVDKIYCCKVKNAVIYNTWNSGSFQTIDYFSKNGDFLQRNEIPAKGVFAAGRTFPGFNIIKFFDDTLDIFEENISNVSDYNFTPKSIKFGTCIKSGKKVFFLADNGYTIRGDHISEFSKDALLANVRSRNYINNINSELTIKGINDGTIEIIYPQNKWCNLM